MMMDSPDLLHHQANNSHHNNNNIGHHTTSSRSFFDFDDIMMEVLDLNNSSSVPLSPPTIMIPNNNNQTPSNNNNHSIIESLGLCFDTMADEGIDSAADRSNTCLAGSSKLHVSPIAVDHHTKQQRCDHQARTQHLKPSSPVTPRLSLDPVSVMRDWEEAIFKATSCGTPIVNVSTQLPPHLHNVNTFRVNNAATTTSGNGSTNSTTTLDESAACSLIHQYLTNNMNNNNNTTQDYLGGVLARCTNMQPTQSTMMKLGSRSPSMMSGNNNGHSRGICKKQRSQATCFQSLQNYTSQQGIVMNNHHQQQALMNNYSSSMNSPSVSSTCSPSATVAMSPANVSTNSFGGQQQMIMNGVGGQHYYSPTSGAINSNGYNQVVFSNQSVNNSLAMNQRKGKVPNGRQPQDKKGVKGQGLLVDINPNDRRVKMTQETVDEKFKLHIEDGINTKKKKQNSLQFHTCKFVPSQ